MMRSLLTVLAFSAAIGAGAQVTAAAAAGSASLRFELRDWELVCDNTRTCRAAGYHAENADHAPVSVLLTRKAGPAQPVMASVRLGDTGDDAPPPGALTMLVGGRPVGLVALNPEDATGRLSPAQADALLRAVAGSGKVAWRADGREWILSAAGATAVLLKMDELQGRLDTPGAAVRKGSRPEESVPAPVPAPVIRAAAVPKGSAPRLDKATERILLADLRKTVAKNDCELLWAAGKAEFGYAPLTQEKMLVSTPCWRAAYNEGDGYWIVNRRPPFAPQPVNQVGSSYEDGSIVSVTKGRGIADCVWRDEWVWDGKGFVATASSMTGMCRGIAAGGAWDLPTLVSEVKH